MHSTTPRANPSRRETVSITLAADYAGVCTKTIRRWIATGQLPGYRIGSRLIRVSLDDVDAMMSPIPTTGNIA